MGTSVDRASASRDLSQNGAPWSIPGEQVDGMDVAAVREAGQRAVAHARAGKGPYLLEMKTYRYRGHSMSDPAKYRAKEEVDEVKKTRDPIDHVKMLLDQAGATEDDLKAIDNEVKAIVAEAVQFAQESPEPDPSELYTDVYVEA
jgi:pyruvate dehydrogenase E1 component alpha subunit